MTTRSLFDSSRSDNVVREPTFTVSILETELATDPESSPMVIRIMSCINMRRCGAGRHTSMRKFTAFLPTSLVCFCLLLCAPGESRCLERSTRKLFKTRRPPFIHLSFISHLSFIFQRVWIRRLFC